MATAVGVRGDLATPMDDRVEEQVRQRAAVLRVLLTAAIAWPIQTC